MALHGTTLFFNGLSSAIKEFNVLPHSFINSFQKVHHVSLPSCTPNNLALSRSFGRGEQICLLHGQSLKLQMGRFMGTLRVKSEDSESTLNGENIALDEETLEEELEKAIAEENYARAAQIRDTLKNLQKDSKTGLFEANSRFYDSFRTGDLAAMQGMWAQKDEVCCVHPGLKGITGYDDIIESWNFIWANYDFPLEIKLEDIKVHVKGDMGFVTCMEFVKTKGGRWGGQFVTNAFEKIDGEWYICIHHASPVDL
ncbi:uncharacterized protein LOC106778656 isoform X1 [Vigna radiata var. radiata]|uniref:Uncharacterized protein LOC106778656 isoform X1 n=1 Tax=Vigna radiata var. radiata TaxID=3916 RepID=A0A1S3VUQ9_VIGRR|nr:uncharacterized protein LOC106778656 isoform X1 [Vigna radiata var. radiata]XP_014522124.1 uncharacterized protein LOC106778656 isoform X1 [Vigna radiata var. radiata]